MATPPSSSNMFFSSSPRLSKDDLEDEVNSSVAKAKLISTLNPILMKAIDSDQQAFFDVFARRIQLIQSRSQAFEDAHITVYDKVLLVLTDHGNKLDNPPAITYFCEEMLGVSLQADSNYTRQALTQVTQVNSAIEAKLPAEVFLPLAEREGSVMHTGVSQNKKTSFERQARFDPANAASFISRILEVYDQAKADYFLAAREKSERTESTARFLRDTAENIIHTLKESNVEPDLWHDVTETYNMAKDLVVEMHGGRKRKFDKFGKALEQSQSQTQIVTGRYSSSPKRRFRLGGRAEGEQAFADRSTYLNHPQGYLSTSSTTTHTAFPGHSRAIDSHYGSGRGGLAFSSRLSNVRRKLVSGADAENDITGKRKKRQPKGRGPSGIPYGYTRPVDSWQPPKYRF